MDTTDLFRNSFIMGLSLLIADSTTSPQRYYEPNIVENVSILKQKVSILSSTNPIDKDKYSLEQLQNNFRRLNSFKFLNENWNGYNGKKIPDDVIEKVKSIITQLDYQPQIFPTGRASLQIEEQLDDSTFYEIEIESNSNFVYISKNGKETEEENVDLIKIKDLINELYA